MSEEINAKIEFVFDSNVRELMQKSLSGLRDLLEEREARMKILLEKDAPDVIVRNERRMIAEAREAILRKGKK